MLTVRAVALLRPRACMSRYKQPPCYASRTRPPRGKSSGFLLCMLCLLPRCSKRRQCCHTPALSARKCPPTELTREDAMRTARARSPEMMLPLPGLLPPRTCDCRLDCLFLMTGTMFYSMGRSHKRRRSDSSSEEGERQHRRRQQPQQHTHIHVHVHQPQQRHPDRSKRRSAHRERCRIQGETRRMESALRELDAQQATEVQAAREEQQSAAQYSDRAPLIPFQANLPRQRPRTPSYEQVMARPPLPSYDEVVGMTADEEEAEHGPSRSGLANPYSLEQLRDISAAVQMQPERPTVITDVLYKTGSYIALALEPHLALHHRDDWVRDRATDVGHQLGFDDAPEPDTVKQGTHAAPRNWRLRLRGRKPQGLTFGISSNAKYGVSQYAWASGAEWLISRIQAQTTAVRPPSPPPEDEDAQPPAYAPRQEFVDQVCADLAWQVPERAVLSASADTCRYSTPLLTQTCLLTSSGSTRNGSCSEATETADDRDLKIRQGAPSPRPMHTLNPASDEQASIAKTESSANHPAKPCARWERPPRHSAERRSVMARAARLLWTSRVSPPSSAAVPDAHRNASIHCHRYLRASLPDPSSMPNRLACLVPFRPLLLLLDQSDQNPTPTQSAHNLAQLVPPDQWAALHVSAHTRAHTHPHWTRDQILRCGDVHPNPGPTSLALINVTALRAHHHEVLDLQEDIVALTETRLTQGAQNAMAFMARQKGWQPFWGAPLLSKTGGIWGAAPGGAALLVREKWPAKQARRDPGCTLSEELWNSGRWLHVIVTPADGKRPLNVIVVYGIPGDHKLNGKLWEAVLTQVAKLGNSPFLIATDANVQLDHYRCMPNLMMTELLSGRIVDVDLLYARTTGQDCQCSYHNGSIKQKPTRIDGILADAKTASAIMKVLPTERCPVPGHKPVTFTFNFKQSAQRVLKFVRLPPMIPAHLQKRKRDQIVKDVTEPYVAIWEKVLDNEASTADQLWDLWTWLAEETMLVLTMAPPPAVRTGICQLPLAPQESPRGRGTKKMLKTVELTPKRMTSSGLPCTAPTKEMSALLSALVPVMKWAASREQAVVPVMGPVPREVLNNWKAIRRRAHRILQLISKGQCVAEHQELLRTVMEAPESAPMTITDLVRLGDKIKMLSRRQLAQEEKKRHQDWREWIEETWTTSPGKVYQWIKEDKYTPTVLIQKEDGTLTGNVPEMDLVIHQKWDPIMRQHADPTLPEPETEPFWRKFGKYVEHHQIGMSAHHRGAPLPSVQGHETRPGHRSRRMECCRHAEHAMAATAHAGSAVKLG